METVFCMEADSWSFPEWIQLLDYLKEHVVSEAFLEEIREKKLDYPDKLRDKLTEPLYDCVNFMVHRSLLEFERELKHAIESGDARRLELSLEFSFRKLRMELHKCLFFEQMEPFSPEDREHLARSVKNDIENRWKAQLEHSVYETILENHNPSLEDVLYFLKKERMFDS